jgi:DNA-binding NarL/FixJ family response regulator
LGRPILKILIVEDNEPFRRFIGSALQQRSDFRIVGEVSDGLEAIQKSRQLQPDLILLDIGLPNLNGIEVAKGARSVAPHARLLFVSQESSSDVVREVLRLGAQGYVHKPHAHEDLLPAIDAVLEGKRFVSRSLAFGEGSDAHRHEVVFCSSDGVLLDAMASFITAALHAGDAVISVVTASHRNGLLQRLNSRGLDVAAAMQLGTFVLWDVHDALATFMVNDWPDTARLSAGFNDLIKRAAEGADGERRRVATCGEVAPALWAAGKIEAAIEAERLWDEMTRSHGVNTLCVYRSSPNQGSDPSFHRLCAEHTTVCSQ